MKLSLKVCIWVTFAALVTCGEISPPAHAEGNGWPTLQEQLSDACINPSSPLAALVAENQDFWMLGEDEMGDDLPIPPWLRVLFRKTHRGPNFIFEPTDPAKGYPLFLKDATSRLVENQYNAGFFSLNLGDDTAASTGEVHPESAPAPGATIGANLSMSGTQTSTRNESFIQINYWNPDLIVGAANESANPQAQFYSTDGGANWNSVDLPILSSDSYHSDPWVDWTSDGTAWTCTMGCRLANAYLRYYRSPDSGATWIYDGTVSGSQSGVDKQMGWVDHSACSPHADSAYFIWHNGTPAYFNRKPPGGAWGTPVQISGSESSGTCIGADIKTNAFGDIFAFWPTTGNQRLVLRKSVDGGSTWLAPVIVASTYDSYDIGVPAQSNRRVLVYVTAGAYRTAARDDVYLAWTDLSGEVGCTLAKFEPGTKVTSTCKTRIWFSRSTDGGSTWSAPVKINDQASNNDQFNPWMAVDETTGAIGIAYNDTVADAGRLKTDIWYQGSLDRGATWSAALKVTTAMTDESSNKGMQYGDYNGASIYAGAFFPSWTDNRGTREEIWTAKVTDCEPPVAPSAPTFSSVTCSGLTVSWTAASGATAYDVYRLSGACSLGGALVASNIAGTSFADSGLSPLMQYSYYIVAKNATCARYDSQCGYCASVTTPACPTPAAKRVPYGSTPLTIRKNDGQADSAAVSFDSANCASAKYHIIYGWGESLSSWAVAGSGGCDLRPSSGPTNWAGIPGVSGHAFLWFLVVGSDGLSTEGSWGLTYPGLAERGGPSASGTCGCTLKDTISPCAIH